MPIARYLALFICLTSLLSAQSGQATLNGRVKDSSGAVMPGTVVTMKNVATNVVTTATTNGEGFYIFGALMPGTYALRAEAAGFKSAERPDIPLRVGDRISLDLTMEVGTSNESVTVSAEIELLRSDDAQAGMVIDNRRIQQLPAYDRNALAFATLTANVNGTSSQGGHDTNFRINGGRSAQAEYYIDGMPVSTGALHNVPSSVPSMEAVGEFNVVTNGLSAEYGRLSGGAVVLATRAGTNQYRGSAYEYFRNDKLNANDWNSNRLGVPIGVFHDNVFGGTFGGPVWIPKLYDGHNKTFFFINFEGTKHRAGNNATLASVPTALEKAGDFSQSLIDNAVKVSVFDPLTGRAVNGDIIRTPFPENKVPLTRFDALSKIYSDYYPLPNRASLPGSSHNQNYVGTSSSPSADNRWTGRLDQNWNSNHISHLTVTRDDNESTSPSWLSALQPHSATNETAHTVAFQHNWTVSPTTMIDFKAGVVRIASWGGSQVDASSKTWGLPALVLNLLGTTEGRVPSLSTGDTVTGLGGGNFNNNFETNFATSGSVQKLVGKHTIKVGYEHRRYFSNLYSAFGGGVGTFTQSTLRSVTSQSVNNPPPTGMGWASWLLGVTTTGSGTQFAGPASLQTYHGLYFQDSYKATTKLSLSLGVRWDYEPPRTERYDRQAFWDRDYVWPWKPAAGFNWNTIMSQNGLDPASTPTPTWITDGVKGRIAFSGTGSHPGRDGVVTQRDHFAPRLGLAYQLGSKTVLRASYGMNWMTVTGSRYAGSASRNIGFGDAARFNGTADNGLTYPLRFSNPMPGGAGYVPYSRDVNALNVASMGTWLVVPDYQTSPGYEHVTSLGIQRQVGTGNKSWVFEANYNGNFARSLPFYLGFGEHILPNAYNVLGKLGNKLNTQVQNPFYGQVPLGTGMGAQTIALGRLFQLNPLWLEIWTVGGPYGNSKAQPEWGLANYNALTLQAEHRFGSGFTVLANYTFSKLLQNAGGIDNGQPQGIGEQGFPQAGLGLGEIYGVAPSDITHKVVFNWSADLPFGKGHKFLGNSSSLLDKIVGGWQFAGTNIFRTGQPIIISTPGGAVGGLGSQWYNIGQGRNSRPVIVPGQQLGFTTDAHASFIGSANPQFYMNPQAFRLTQGFEIGNVPSAFSNWRGPNYTQLDVSLMKNIALGENRRLQLRFESQNVLNHMNPGMPDGAVTSVTFGRITNTQAPGSSGGPGLPRRMMIAAKFYF